MLTLGQSRALVREWLAFYHTDDMSRRFQFGAFLLSLALLGISGAISAQQSGRAVYRAYTFYAADSGKLATLDFSPQRAVYVGEEYTGELRTKLTKQVFTQDNGHQFINQTVTIYPGDVYVQSNYLENQMASYATMVRGNSVFEYVVEESIPRIRWELVDSTRTIANMEAHAAKGTFRGRTYLAWYVPAIPVSSGPWKLSGLPGLIVEATELHGVFAFILQSIEIQADHQVPEVAFPKTATRIPLSRYAYYHDNKSASENELLQARAPRGAELTTKSDADGGDPYDVELNFRDLVDAEQ